ncbi:hypothetical protein, partial [Winogradskyella poriferorum]|uniref:hypothetical protein n=1 Tax=Winogradskyella poriferorum TaxID=307627 RepID=UPI003D649916
NTPEDIALCEDITNEGFETFNLRLRIDDILGTQDPMIFNVSFHLSQDDANDNVGAEGTNHTYTNAVSEEIFVRVEDPLQAECFDTTLFNVIVNPLPEIVAVTPLQVCDDDTDGFMEFPLSTKTNEILAGQTDILVTYHESLDGAQNQTDEIFDG